VADMKVLVRHGADKVSLNAAAVVEPQLIRDGARNFGSQCIVVSIDARRKDGGQYEGFTHSGTKPTGLSPVELAKRAQEHGAGEILLNSIDRDGSKEGYDLELLGRVVDAVSIPVIACGGANHSDHFASALKLDVSAVAAANFFHYTEHSVVVLKSCLTKHGESVRLDTYATYRDFEFDSYGRAAKKPDPVLEKQRFEYIPEEVI